MVSLTLLVAGVFPALVSSKFGRALSSNKSTSLQAHNCPVGYYHDSSKMDVDSKKGYYEDSWEQNSVEDCGKLCNGDYPRCSAFEWSNCTPQTSERCNDFKCALFTNSQVQEDATEKEWPGVTLCLQNKREADCPAGYSHDSSKMDVHSTVGYNESDPNTVEECAQYCNEQNTTCAAFEWSICTPQTSLGCNDFKCALFTNSQVQRDATETEWPGITLCLKN